MDRHEGPMVETIEVVVHSAVREEDRRGALRRGQLDGDAFSLSPHNGDGGDGLGVL